MAGIGIGERMELFGLHNAGEQTASSRLAQEAAGELSHVMMQAYAKREQARIFNILENASQKVETGKLNEALPGYHNAIQKADLLNQTAIARERAYVQEQLKQQSTSPAQRRQLLQEEADLHDLQRAPGVTRANLGLLLLRQGRVLEGTLLILEAQKLDREMIFDPNFARHLNDAQRDRQTFSYAPRRTFQVAGDAQRPVTQGLTQPSPETKQGPAPDGQAARPATPQDVPYKAAPWRPDASTGTSPQAAKPETPVAAKPDAQPAKQEAKPDKPELSDAEKKKNLNLMLEAAEARKGDILAAKQYYEQAIKQADALYNNPAKTRATIDDLQAALTAGKYKDNSGAERTVTTQDRLEAHQTIVNLIDTARTPFMVRMVYSNALKAAKEYADAERVMLEARIAADKLPIDAIKKESSQLQVDAAKVDLPAHLQNQWSTTAQELRQLSMAPIRSRYDLIQFYLAGGKTPDGGIIGDVYLNDKKEVVKIDTKVLKPEKSAEIIQETIKREKELLGIDLEKEPGLDPELLKFRELARQNSPETLKAHMRKLSNYWPDLGSDIVAGVTGVAITLGILYLAKNGGGAAVAETGLLSQLGTAAGWLGKPGAIGVGLLSSIGARHVIKKNFFGDETETWMNSAFHGGTSYLAIGGLYLAKGKLSDYYYGNFTPEKVGERAFEALTPAERTVGGLAKAITGKGIPLPAALSDALNLPGGAARELTAHSAGHLLESSGQQGATLLRTVFGKVGAQVQADAGFYANLKSMASATVRPISADVIPSSSFVSPFMVSKLAVGTGTALTYETIKTIGLSSNDWRNGVEVNGKAVTPWGVMGHRLGLNQDNIFVNSFIEGLFLGGVNPASTATNPVTAFANARCLGIGPFGSCQIAFKSAVSVPGLSYAEANLSQRVGQLGWSTLMGNLGPIGKTQIVRYEAKTYQELLDRANRPISNETPRPILPAPQNITSSR